MSDKTISGTDTRKNDRLLPCPFCGGEATVIDYRNDGLVGVGCSNDTCLGFSGLGWSYKTETEAIAAWNTRAERTCENGMPRSYNYLECSLCGSLAYKGSAEFRYCPNCGAKVVS